MGKIFGVSRRLAGPLAVALAGLMTQVAMGQGQHGAGAPAPGRFALAADKTFKEGVASKLPPHIATLLGLAREAEWPAKQGVLRSGKLVEGIDVSVARKSDIVLFVVDEMTKDQDYYLTSPEGKLRKLVSVRAGVGAVTPVTEKEQGAFKKEKQFWADRLAPAAAAK